MYPRSTVTMVLLVEQRKDNHAVSTYETNPFQAQLYIVESPQPLN